MGSQSGKYGQVDFGASAYAEATAWTMDQSADGEQYGLFGGGGHKRGTVGNRFATGTIEGKYDFADPLEDLINAGEEITLKLYLSTTSAPNATDKFFTVPAQVLKISYGANADTGETVSWSLDWQSNGPVLDP